MQFLQPILLWGLLGISIPILIHLWQGKKGQVIYWAAMHWLSEQESSAAKGFRLDNILLLLLRILLLVLLVLILSQIYFNSPSSMNEARVIYLFQPEKLLAEEYKFEIQQALEMGEEVYWMDAELTPIESLEDLDKIDKVLNIQAALDGISTDVTDLNLYLSNSSNSFKSEFYLSPLKPNLYIGNVELIKPADQVISIDGRKTLEVNELGLLNSISDSSDLESTIVMNHDQFTYFLGGISDSERVFVKASLDAIAVVYGFEFVEKQSLEEANLIFDSHLPTENSSEKLYFISGDFSFPEQSNLISFSDQLDYEHSDIVQTGKLPEVILSRFLEYSGIEKQDVPLSQAQLASRFLVESKRGEAKKSNLNLLLLGLFALCFGAERFMANRQGK